ncbi:hypothetical protein [Mycobacterium riyadhense]|uniref:hypothetical protein n=1 Tax=Mycobacterium riyadhense TaxID=486698 RepID=UPI00194E89AC|nr:hypothetical protein [Mycobacterium riyadhense]
MGLRIWSSTGAGTAGAAGAANGVAPGATTGTSHVPRTHARWAAPAACATGRPRLLVWPTAWRACANASAHYPGDTAEVSAAVTIA